MVSQEDALDALTLNSEGQDQPRTIMRSAEAACTRSSRKRPMRSLPKSELSVTGPVVLVIPLLLNLLILMLQTLTNGLAVTEMSMLKTETLSLQIASDPDGPG